MPDEPTPDIPQPPPAPASPTYLRYSRYQRAVEHSPKYSRREPASRGSQLAFPRQRPRRFRGHLFSKGERPSQT